MIMTESQGNHLSLKGLALAGAMAVVAILTSSAWSCPEDENASVGYVVVPSAQSNPVIALVNDPQDQGRRDSGGRDSDEVQRLMAEIERLRAELSRLEAKVGELRHRSQPSAPFASPGPMGRDGSRFAPSPFWDGGECSNAYSMGRDKADAMYALLAPSDVKVIVSRTSDGIQIRGQGEECPIVEAFMELYLRGERHGSDGHDNMFQEWRNNWTTEEMYRVGDERAELFYDVLAFDNVPVLVSHANGGVNVSASPRDQHIVAQFVRIISGESSRQQSDGFWRSVPGSRVSPPDGAAPRRPSAPRGRADGGLYQPTPMPDGDCEYRYSMLEEKADAIYELIAPSDVPIVVSRTNDGVTISGKGGECDAIDRFMELYLRGDREGFHDYDETMERWQDRWNTEETYRLEASRAELFFDVLAFENVPVLVSLADDGVTVEATVPDQRAVSDFVNIIRGRGGRPSGAGRSSDRRSDEGDYEEWAASSFEEHPDDDGIRSMLAAELARARLGESSDEAAEARREAEIELREAQRELENESRQLQREYDQMRREAEQELAQARRDLQREAEDREREEQIHQEELQRERENLQQEYERMQADRNRGERSDRERDRRQEQSSQARERRYEISRERAELIFNLLAPDYVEDVIVGFEGDVLVVRGAPEDLNAIDRIVEILTRHDADEAPSNNLM